jgi:hypothetical protein
MVTLFMGVIPRESALSRRLGAMARLTQTLKIVLVVEIAPVGSGRHDVVYFFCCGVVTLNADGVANQNGIAGQLPASGVIELARRVSGAVAVVLLRDQLGVLVTIATGADILAATLIATRLW